MCVCVCVCVLNKLYISVCQSFDKNCFTEEMKIYIKTRQMASM